MRLEIENQKKTIFGKEIKVLKRSIKILKNRPLTAHWKERAWTWSAIWWFGATESITHGKDFVNGKWENYERKWIEGNFFISAVILCWNSSREKCLGKDKKDRFVVWDWLFFAHKSAKNHNN